MSEILQVADQYYVLASSVLADRETRVLKQGETFAIFDRYGDINPVTHNEVGIFHRGTRFLSNFTFQIADGRRPLLLNSILRDDSGVLKVEMTNPDLNIEGVGFLPKGTLHIHREKFLADGCCHEKITVANFGHAALVLPANVTIAADYADTFEVRGMRRERRGETKGWTIHSNHAVMVYEGLDGIRRTTTLHFDDNVVRAEGNRLNFSFIIPPYSEVSLQFDVTLHLDAEPPCRRSHEESLSQLVRGHAIGRRNYCSINTSNDQFDAWLRRSTDDLVMMTTMTSTGIEYPYAGIPWFCTPFGRDGVITALECLWAHPSMARGVLAYLSETQSHTSEPERDSTPGKIIHEIRYGEMANLNEVPFGRYYGSIDSTPLYLILASAYFNRTNDLEFIRSIWPSILKATEWIDKYGDIDNDGYVEYAAETPRGLAQQGWKDSFDSIFHADGSDAPGPIALCEVQGYVYLAKSEIAALAAVLGDQTLAMRLKYEAENLKARFNRDFWLEDMQTYALALDGDKRPCRVMSSNAGQCLFTKIVPEERARLLATRLMQPEMFSGWGVRTIAAQSHRYNPMSYHNGSVWPHDTALIAWGLDRYGFKQHAETLFEGLYRAATYMDLFRMPEVFCGFPRRGGEAPTLYHHACSPQAWAAGSVYMCLQSVLGISIDGPLRRVSFTRPRLPEFIDSIEIKNLHVAGETIDLSVKNYKNDVSVQILERQKDIVVFVEK